MIFFQCVAELSISTPLEAYSLRWQWGVHIHPNVDGKEVVREEIHSLVLSCLVLSCLVLSCLVLSCLITLLGHPVVWL
jgi:hypothetical protein